MLAAVRLQFLGALQQQGGLRLDAVVMKPCKCEDERQSVGVRALACLYQCLITP